MSIIMSEVTDSEEEIPSSSEEYPSSSISLLRNSFFLFTSLEIDMKGHVKHI